MACSFSFLLPLSQAPQLPRYPALSLPRSIASDKDAHNLYKNKYSMSLTHKIFAILRKLMAVAVPWRDADRLSIHILHSHLQPWPHQATLHGARLNPSKHLSWASRGCQPNIVRRQRGLHQHEVRQGRGFAADAVCSCQTRAETGGKGSFHT